MSLPSLGAGPGVFSYTADKIIDYLPSRQAIGYIFLRRSCNVSCFVIDVTNVTNVTNVMNVMNVLNVLNALNVLGVSLSY